MLRARTRPIDLERHRHGRAPSRDKAIRSPHASHGGAPASTGAQHRLNDALAVALVGLVAVAPIPVGSNRPVFWAMSAMIVGVIAAVYWLRMASLRQRPRFPLTRILPELVLFCLLCAFLLLQTVPLGAFLAAARPLLPKIGDLQPDTLSLAPGATWLMLLRMLTYGLFFVMMLQVSVNSRRAHVMIGALFAVTIAYAVLGLFFLTQLNDTIFGLEKWAYPGAATATFVNRNSYATFLAMGMALGSVVLLQSLAARSGVDSDIPNRFRGLRVAAVILGLLFIVAALLATQSRLGLFVGVVGSAVVLVLGVGRAGVGWRTTTALLLAAAIAFVVIGTNLSGVFDRALSVAESGDVRMALYQQVLGMISQRPLLGYGGGSFDVVYPLFHLPPVQTDLVWEKAHSTYLQLWVELGVIAGSIPLAIVALALGRAVMGHLTAQRNWQAGLACVGVTFVGAAHSVADFSLEIQAVTFLFLAVLAIGAASWKAERSL